MTFACSGADDTSCGAGWYCEEQPASNQYWGTCVPGVRDIVHTDQAISDVPESPDPGVQNDVSSDTVDAIDVTLADVGQDLGMLDLPLDSIELDIQPDIVPDFSEGDSVDINADLGEINEDL